MLDRTQLVRILSGQRNGIGATLVRICLGCLTPIYRCALWLRNRKFDKAVLNGNNSVIRKTRVPVISIGNLTTGGTGKTPMVIWLTQELKKHGLNVALVSRGYGTSNEQNDEDLNWNNGFRVSFICRIPIGFEYHKSPSRTMHPRSLSWMTDSSIDSFTGIWILF